MDTQTELETTGLFEARYVAFLETLTHLARGYTTFVVITSRRHPAWSKAL